MRSETERRQVVSKPGVRVLLIGLLLVAAGCASVPLRDSDRARLADADAGVLSGCLSCLVDAREVYESLASTAARPLVVSRLFEVNILIALRQSELAVAPTDALARATALLPELARAPEVTLALDLARLGMPESVGTPRAAARQWTRDAQAFTAHHGGRVPAALAPGVLSAPFVAYLTSSWTCLPDVTAAPDIALRNEEAGMGSAVVAPLVAYRRATCPRADANALDTLLAAHPDFVEAGYVRARMPSLALTTEYVAMQRTAFDAAREAFPTSAAVTYSLGTLNQTLGDCRTALTYYDATLRLAPAHEEAALQRVVCLGFLGRHETAINAASAVIDEKFFNADDALYWRAWNRNQLRQVAEARTDIDRALAIRANARNYGLAGVIKYHQEDFLAAEHDLEQSVQMDRTMCLSRWYLGLVAFERERWPATGAAFEAAADCYRTSADEARRQLAAIEAADLDPVFKENQILGFNAAIQEDTSQEHASCLNGANGFLRADNHAGAAALLSRIPADSAYASGADQLREYLAELAAVGAADP